jgi:hypothetical protein
MVKISLTHPRGEHYSWVEHFAKICGGLEWRKVLLSAFTCYFDASGSETDQPCLAVGGFVALAEQWLQFETEWNAALVRFHLSYFRVSEVNQDPRFKNNPTLLKDLYIALIQIIRDNVLRQFGCGIFSTTMNLMTAKEREEWKVSMYGIAGRACAGQVRTWCTQESIPILPELVFERGDFGSESLKPLLVQDGFQEPIFRSKKDFLRDDGFLERGAIPLQAADLLAFELFDPMRKIANDGHLKKIRPSAKALDEIRGTPTYLSDTTMGHHLKINRLEPFEIWMPDGPDDKPIHGI